MAINFPNSPSVNDQHTSGGVTWTWDGTTWKADGVTSSYVLPTASSTVLGGVKVGSGLSISTGTLSTSAIALDDLSDVSTSGVNSGEILKYNGTSWAPAADDAGSGSSLTVQNQGTSLATAATTLNFVGANVTASGTGATKTITVAGASETTWTLGASGTNHYTFTGDGFTGATNDPTLYLVRGQTYKFDNQTGGHPFRIQSDPATSGGGTVYSNGVTNQDATGGTATNVLTFIVPMDAPNTLYYQCTAHDTMSGTINVLTQAGTGLQSRNSANNTTASLANDAAGDLTIAVAKTYVLHKIQTDKAAWVTVYTDGTARTADSGRNITTDPTPGSGVIAEVITTGANTQAITPGTIGWNNDGTPSTNAYLKVVNKSGGAGTVQVTLHFVQLEA